MKDKTEIINTENQLVDARNWKWASEEMGKMDEEDQKLQTFSFKIRTVQSNQDLLLTITVVQIILQQSNFTTEQ